MVVSTRMAQLKPCPAQLFGDGSAAPAAGVFERRKPDLLIISNRQARGPELRQHASGIGFGKKTDLHWRRCKLRREFLPSGAVVTCAYTGMRLHRSHCDEHVHEMVIGRHAARRIADGYLNCAHAWTQDGGDISATADSRQSYYCHR